MLNFYAEINIEGNFDAFTGTQIDQIEKYAAQKVRVAVKASTPVSDRKTTGTAKKSWTPVKKVEGGHSFGSNLPYMASLLSGSVPGKRPWPWARRRTRVWRGKIYSSQSPGGMLVTSKADEIAQKAVSEKIEALIK